MANQFVDGYNTKSFTPFQSGCTKCNPSLDYYNYYAQQKEVQTAPVLRGGNKKKNMNIKKIDNKKINKNKKGGAEGNYSNDGLIPKSTGDNLYVPNKYDIPIDKLTKDNLGIDYKTSGGSKNNKEKKNNNKKIIKDVKDNKEKKTITKKMISKKGGGESAGATAWPMRYFDKNFKEPLDVVNKDTKIVGYNDYNNNYGTVTKTGGSKKSNTKKNLSDNKKSNKKIMKGGQESEGATSIDNAFFNVNAKKLDFPVNSGEGINSAYGPIKVGNVGTGMLAPYTASNSSTANHNTMQQTGGKKKIVKRAKNEDSKKKVVKGGKNDDSKKKTLSKKVVKGGKNDDSKKKTLSKKVVKGGKKNDDSKKKTLSKKVIKGGKKNDDSKKKTLSKKVKNIKQKGGDLIPYISDDPVNNVTGTIGGAIDGFSSFMQNLDNAYQRSINDIRNIKIGDQRLIQGGSKKNNKNIKKGGNGSDFANTLNSRGPWNAPDDYWGKPGELWFRQFNKTGDYIPNSRLAVAATPELAGVSHPTVSGYDENIFGPTNSWA